MIYIGADKHGFKVIEFVAKWLEEKKYEHTNLGVKTPDEDIALQDLLPHATSQILQEPENKGIISCGTGVGIEVGINKFSGIRACLATDPEIAKWSRVYDDCNVLCLSGWKNDQNLIRSILESWFSSEYDGSQKRRVMFSAFDSWH